MADNWNASGESFQDLSSRSVRDRYNTILKNTKHRLLESQGKVVEVEKSLQRQK